MSDWEAFLVALGLAAYVLYLRALAGASLLRPFAWLLGLFCKPIVPEHSYQFPKARVRKRRALGG